MKKMLVLVLVTMAVLAGCGGDKNEAKNDATPVSNSNSSSPIEVTSKSSKMPVFSLAYSEYPSWSTFGVAGDNGLIEPLAGKVGTLEKKHGIDIELRLLDYDTCVTQYSSSTCDAACIANVDSLAPSVGRKTTAIMTTSTSYGADALVAVGVDKLEDLKGVKVYGLEKSVSQFAFTRILEKRGLNVADFPFSQMDPGGASQALQTKQPSVTAIMVWEPFVLQTLRLRTDAKRLADSKELPNEIFDLVLVGNDSLAKDGGHEFATCVCDVFYSVNKLMKNEDTSDATYVALGSKFSNLDVNDMKLCCEEVKFFTNSNEGQSVFTGSDLPTAMKLVSKFCVDHEMVTTAPEIGYGDPRSQLNFDPQFMLNVK